MYGFIKIRVIFKFITGIILLYNFHLYAQPENGNTDHSLALKIHIQNELTGSSKPGYELPYTIYIENPDLAQVLITISEQTGNNGDKVISITFTGKGEFSGIDDTHTFMVSNDESTDEVNKKIKQILNMGLMRYVARTRLSENIIISYTKPAEPQQVEDKWRSWVFSFNMSGSVSGEESSKSLNMNSGMSVKKITEKWKFKTYANQYYYKTDYYLEDDTITSLNNSKNITQVYVKSIGEHWAVGELFRYSSSTHSNTDLHLSLYPAIEYDLFPYSEASKRLLRFKYAIGGTKKIYTDTTIYNKIEESFLGHDFNIVYEIKENWGSVYSSVYFSQYFHDLELNSLSFSSNISVRIIKGLSVWLYGYISLIHDQISLPKGEISVEEILTHQKQLKTQYSYMGSMGISYTFGSVDNTVVNPRFGW